MDELIKSITEAEEKASAIKSDAVLRAGRIIEAARAEAAKIEAESAEQRVKYLNERLEKARAEAEKQYASSIEKSTADAKRYAQQMKGHTDVTVGKIVGRITDGNC